MCEQWGIGLGSECVEYADRLEVPIISKGLLDNLTLATHYVDDLEIEFVILL